MFSNFVTFKEVVKLSPNVFWKMKEVNYNDKLLDLIYLKEDVNTFGEVSDLIENKRLVTKFINVLSNCKQFDEKKWLENIFKFIEDIDISISGDKLLVYSSKYGFYDAVRYLVEKGVDPHFQYDLALRWAVDFNYLEIVKYLVERPDCKVCNKQCIHGSDIHVLDDCVLRWAAEFGYLDIVKYLVNAGANIHAGDDIALLVAVESNHFDIVKYLVERPDCKVCKKCCCHGANILADDNLAVIRAVECGNVNIFKYLVKHGGNPHARNNLALKWSIKNNYHEISNYIRRMT